MIYLAVLLVLTGLLIVLVALFSESGRTHFAKTVNFRESSAPGFEKPGRVEPEDIDIILPERRKHPVSTSPLQHSDEEDIFLGFDRENSFSKENKVTRTEKRGKSLDEWGLSESEQDDIIPDSGPLDEVSDSVFSELEDELSIPDRSRTVAAADSPVYAVLFDDKSNLIDYDSGVTIIEPSVSALKSIKRVGKGKVQVDEDGVSFYMDDKFYRFDFHKVYDVWSGAGFIALPLKGGSSVKLFMIDNAPDFPGKVEVYYQEYIKGI